MANRNKERGRASSVVERKVVSEPGASVKIVRLRLSDEARQDLSVDHRLSDLKERVAGKAKAAA